MYTPESLPISLCAITGIENAEIPVIGTTMAVLLISSPTNLLEMREI